MTICVFVGPTLPVNAAEEILDAIYLPPARRGDIARAILAHEPECIGLIDGYFEQVPSVWHKELLWALDLGIMVYGAASMGALRSAELAQFGMIGVGRIFEAYATGSFDPFPEPFEDDDEVAVVHGPAEIGYPSTDAMVDIRASLVAAHQAGVLEMSDMFAMAASAKGLFYKHRTWAVVLELAEKNGVTEAGIAALRSWLPENGLSQKRMDAEELLQKIKTAPKATDVPLFRFERTLHWQSALDAMQTEQMEVEQQG